MYRKIISAALIILSAILLFNNSSISEENKNLRSQGDVLVITFSGVINPVAAEYINKSINKAAAMKAEALIIKLDTPGGLDTSMRSIVKDIIRSDVPVVVYVSPSGSRAASAGTFITMAAHIAAMSPGTTIGAAHPVAVGQRMDEAVIEKAVSDAAAYIKSIAEQRGRNARWAEDAVRKSISATETEALKENVIDLVAKDINELLSAIDGKTVKTAAEDKVLNTANAKLVQHEMGFRLKVLDIISNPTIAYILMLLGFYGLFFELTSPGSIFPGVFGAICLILAFYAFQTLPVNYAGILLIALGIILFILEAILTSYGLLTIGGIVSLVMGSLMLFEYPLPLFRLYLPVVLAAAIITALFFIVTLKLALKAHKRKPVTGIEGIRGEEGIAKADITPERGGMVIVHGEYWSAYSDEVIHKGEQILVEDVKGLKVKVRKATKQLIN
jgi:membrane-bound serine protease (ClpP class)